MITTIKMGAFVLVFLSFAAVCGAAVSEPNVVYVDDNSPGPTRDGQSWATAYRYLQDALQNAASGDYICVAQGVYKPDRIYGLISHLSHITAVALVNANDFEDMKFSGRGFIDTSRLASGPADVWTDILLTNSCNITPGIDRLIRQLTLMKKAVAARDAKAIEKLLERARTKREKLIEYKLRRRELL